MSKLSFISTQATTWTLADLCQVLSISWSSYSGGLPARRQFLIGSPTAQQAFTRCAGRYNTRRLRAELQEENHRVGFYALRGWLRASGQYVTNYPAPAPAHP